MVFYEWDETKAESNRIKHGIDFDDAIEVFGDPFAITEMDYFSGNEMRWRTIGEADSTILLFVAYTVQEEGVDEVIRIISARRATKKEGVGYGTNRQENS